MEATAAKNWCKIFTLEDDNQVLVTKDFDSDEDKFLIRIECRFEIEEALITPAINLNYDEEEDRNTRFDEIDIETAITSFNALENEVKQILS